ncbi:Ig-like domain-containing protein [Kocuria aegyptia]|uniref:Peptidoglycan recognition protein family domain-containing protein n=1 Tax=Kocuria aegyptia TaxID=330943 RepID=A0ABN2KNM1_9MICC
MRRFLGFFTHVIVVGFFVSLAVVWSGPAQARTVPETLAEAKPVQAGEVTTAFSIDYVGVLWDTPVGQEHAAEAPGPEPHGAVRLRHDGTWGPWLPLGEDGVTSEGQWASGLVPAGDAQAYQVRGIPAGAESPRAVAMNTTDGPRVTVDQAPGGSAQALNSSQCRTRAEWGADESLRHDAAGKEVWAPQFYDAQVTTVHHTATTNNDPDPAATVRALYRYHAIDQGFGDIGYQYLIDESGIVYEGRWSGAASTSCGAAGGTGADFAHEEGTDRMVTGAHVVGWNSGNLGVALLGEFTNHRRFGADPKPAAVSSLKDLLAELALRHDLDPTATVTYTNPVNGTQKTVPTIGGHRDYEATECPGERLYAQLPTIRLHVADRMAASADDPPIVALTTPADDATVSGTVPLTAEATDDVGVTKVAFAVDGTTVGTDTDGADGWTASWDTATVADGAHTVSATAIDATGQTSTDLAGVTVANNDVAADSMHVGDLDGTTQAQKNRWTATVVTTVVDNTGAPVAGATVQGTWSADGTTGSCQTAADGTCAMSSPSTSRTTSSMSFTVGSLTHPTALSYVATGNTDPDGDSDGTTITVTRSS